MKVKQISTNGFSISEVFDTVALDKLVNMVNTAPVSVIKLAPHSHRDEYILTGEEQEYFKPYFVDELRKLTPEFSTLSTFTTWRDYPGYSNADHYDCDCFKHIMIVYLGDGNNGINGTRWVEDGQEFGVPYTINTGLILLNCEFVLHGMTGVVENMDYRRLLYIGWS
jgi:hypothetical protein